MPFLIRRSIQEFGRSHGGAKPSLPHQMTAVGNSSEGHGLTAALSPPSSVPQLTGAAQRLERAAAPKVPPPSRLLPSESLAGIVYVVVQSINNDSRQLPLCNGIDSKQMHFVRFCGPLLHGALKQPQLMQAE